MVGVCVFVNGVLSASNAMAICFMDLNYKSHSENYVGKNVWNFGAKKTMCPFAEEPVTLGFGC